MRAPRGTVVFVALALLAGALPRMAAGLEYDRAAMLRGELWRPLTGQLVHWSRAMALADLSVLAAAGLWVERRSPARAWLAMGASLLAVASTVALSPALLRYRGSSGVATALVVVTLTELSAPLAAAGLLLLGVKIAVEVVTGASLLPGLLPGGVVLTPAVHVAGALTGLAVGLTVRARA